ncbi:MAG: group III truncated hemoglobin [Flavobacteriales bacterium]|nr:group III truncated hemoglobin [Flavobacteriales bacterium]
MNPEGQQADISTPADIRTLVDAFYAKVRIDPLLGGIFHGVIRDRWPEHLEKMYRFWGTVLLGEQSYQGAPFRPHKEMPVQQAHFDRWLDLFHATVDAHFKGPMADLAKANGERMAAMFMERITFFREHPERWMQ